jgi:thiosulfate reductase cytochrome b subunit
VKSASPQRLVGASAFVGTSRRPRVPPSIRNVRHMRYDSRVGDSACVPSSASAVPAMTVTSRHSALVRVTHWITSLCFLALLVSGVEIVISHPRFYWGETGNVLTQPLFKLPIPASRALVPTGYGYVLPDQNGWSRYLHFQAAWVVVLTGLLYLISGFFTGHFWRNLLPRPADLSWRPFSIAIANHLRFKRPSEAEAWSYNVLQRLTYLFVIFVLFPLVIWTGLAMSPAFVSALPATVTVLGGQQSARTIHFFVSVFLLLFLLVHVVMVCIAGFRSRMRAMIMGRAGTHMERT